VITALVSGGPFSVTTKRGPMTVKTRFAPSPTGYLHIGGARTALFSWLYARRHGGSFVLRIEDTDQERSTPEAINAILDGMAWLGLDYDEGPHYQSQRGERYAEVLDQLLASGHAYRCYCSKERLDALREDQKARKEKPGYDGRCRDLAEPPADGESHPVIRFRMPSQGSVNVDDRVRGYVSFQNSELDDLIIARADGSPTYNLVVVVDDMDMGMTHVIRGDDHLNNTARQVNLLKALDVAPPAYAHVPMILDEEGRKLSKRSGSASVMDFRDQGYLPEAVVNYLVRLGWSHGDQEIFTPEEMVAYFDIDAINQSASSLNSSKLAWLNQHYMKTLDSGYVGEHLAWHLRQLGVDTGSGPSLSALVRCQAERTKTLTEMAQNSVFFYRRPEGYEEKAARKNLKGDAAQVLATVRQRLADLDDWSADTIYATVQGTAEALGLKMGKVAQPIRVAVSGGAISPPIDATLELLGRAVALERIQAAEEWIAANLSEA